MFPKSAVFPLIGDSNTRLTADHKRISNKALANIIEPFPNYPDIKFGGNFNWAHQEPELSTSYSLYLQNLRVVGTMLAVFEHTRDEKLLDKCDQIVLSWMEFVEAGGEVEMTWYDHAVGARCRVLTQYLSISEEMNRPYDKARFTAMLEKHAEILMDDSHHRMNNHGIMMDNALLSLGLGLERMDYFYHGMERVKAIFWQTFSETGMHQENSPEYHSMVQRMFKELESYLNANSFTLGADILRKFPYIAEHSKRLVKPDGKIPAIGDSSHNSTNLGFDWGSFHDQMSGFTLLKNRANELYLAFICGFSATAHKHADDLSVILNYGGKDFFVDAGKYNYGNNRYRRFVVSKSAHSSFMLDRNYTRVPDNRYSKMIATDHYLNSEIYSLVSGYNRGYENASLRRTVYSIPSESLLIIDDRGSNLKNEKEVWQQRFTLSPESNARILKNDTVMVQNGDRVIYLKIQSESEPRIEIIDSQEGEVFISERTKNITPTSQIVIKYDQAESIASTITISLGYEYKGKVTVDRSTQAIGVERPRDPELTDLIIPTFSL